MQRVVWEYRVVTLGPSSSQDAERILNELGAEGWELMMFQPGHARAYAGEGAFYFKRPAAEGSDGR